MARRKWSPDDDDYSDPRNADPDRPKYSKTEWKKIDRMNAASARQAAAYRAKELAERRKIRTRVAIVAGIVLAAKFL